MPPPCAICRTTSKQCFCNYSSLQGTYPHPNEFWLCRVNIILNLHATGNTLILKGLAFEYLSFAFTMEPGKQVCHVLRCIYPLLGYVDILSEQINKKNYDLW